MKNFTSANSKILALFTTTGKDMPTPDSAMGKAVAILQTICDSQSHTIHTIDPDTSIEDAESEASEIFDALEEIESHIGDDEFTLDFDGAEYRIISEDAIWGIYKDEIEYIVNECYDLKLDKLPDFIAVSIDWEQTAQNAFVDGYGHTFSGYDGSEEEAAGFYIFRTN